MHTIARVIALTILATWIGTVEAQVCDDSNPCTTNDMCGEEECNGTPVEAGGCDDFNPCTVNDVCTPTGCTGEEAPVGTTCAGGCGTCEHPLGMPEIPVACAPLPEISGAACEPLIVGGVSNPCLEGECLAFGEFVVQCIPSVKQCPDTDGDKCTDFCNFETGECEVDASICIPDCEICNQVTGTCQPANLGSACEDFDVCTAQSRCEQIEGRGLCLPGEPSEATPTAPLPTATAPAATPTAPLPTATAPAATPTAPLPTATAPAATPTAPLPTATAPAATPTAPLPTATAPAATPTGPLPTATEPAATPTGPLPTATEAAATPTGAVATATSGATNTPGGPTSTPTEAPTAAPVCVGDCTGDDLVRVNELIVMTNIALDLAPVSDCFPGDEDGNGSIAVNELIRATGFALEGCPGAAAGQ